MKTFSTPLEAFNHWAVNAPDKLYLRQRINGSNLDFTYHEADMEIRKFAAALKELELTRGSHIAILSKNCAHWVMADIAIMMAGCVSIPIYPTLDAEGIKQILSHSDSTAIIVGKLDNYDNQKNGINDSIKKIGIRLYGINEKHTWEDLTARQNPLAQPEKQKPEDLITIMYTSGTTGAPKGVMHKVSSFNAISLILTRSFSLPPHPRFFSYLPLSHIAERIGIESSCTYLGGSLNFPESLDTFANDLKAVQPQAFLGVPRIWEKFKEKILEKLTQRRLNLLLKIPFVSEMLKRKIKRNLGLSEAKAFTGAAPVAVDLLKWFERLDIIIHQVYATTEDCLHNHFNLPDTNKFGTCGKPLPGVEVKFSSQGEIQIKSECLTIGYYKDPGKSAEIFSKDKFLKTGDLGNYDPDGFLIVTGRIKDQFKTDKGKYINPAPLELQLLKNRFIDQVCVVGTGIAQPIALVVPSEEGKKKHRNEIQESLLTSLEHLNENLQNYEKILKVVVMCNEWTMDNDFLTPTLKIKRNRIDEIYRTNYSSWYSRPDRIIFES